MGGHHNPKLKLGENEREPALWLRTWRFQTFARDSKAYRTFGRSSSWPLIAQATILLPAFRTPPRPRAGLSPP